MKDKIKKQIMKDKIKYIYFERYRITGYGQTDFEIRNINILLIKPDTGGEDSSGINECMNITERFGFPEKSYFVVDQFWVDLDKYKYNDNELNKNIKYVLNKLENVKDTRLSIDELHFIQSEKIYIPNNETIVEYINKKLKDKTIALGWNRDIFEYTNIHIKTKDNIIVDLIYNDNGNEFSKIIEIPFSEFQK